MCNTLKTKLRLFYLKTQFVPRSKHYSTGYKNHSVYAESSTSRCLFLDKYVQKNTVWVERIILKC